jgi:ribonuclease HI
MDSLLVCKQLRGEWQCKADHLKNYFDQCYGLLQRIRLTGIQIDLQHIYREFNKDADHLANLGADGQSSHRNWY